MMLKKAETSSLDGWVKREEVVEEEEAEAASERARQKEMMGERKAAGGADSVPPCLPKHAAQMYTTTL